VGGAGSRAHCFVVGFLAHRIDFQQPQDITLGVVLLALLVALSTAAQDEGPPRTGFRSDAPPYAIRGAHVVGYMTFDDRAAERPMTGGILCPALNPEGVEEACIYDVGIGDFIPELNNWDGRAIRNAAPDTSVGPYPLVVFSHGANGTLLWTASPASHMRRQDSDDSASAGGVDQARRAGHRPAGRSTALSR
jgi:hypothetical protein